MSDLVKPGKPHLAGQPESDKISIEWDCSRAETYSQTNFQLRYKNVTTDKNSKWQYHKDCLSENYFTLQRINPKSKFVFQVRIVSDDDEGPYSESSDVIETIDFVPGDQHKGSDVETVIIPQRILPQFTEDKNVRNGMAKTRRFVTGQKKNDQEKTIMILGPTGGGKTSLVDAMMNYIYDVSWDDNFRYSVEAIQEPEELANKKNQALSQTSWITCYKIHPTKVTIPYSLTIIDTPGFGSVKGIEEDKKIVKQIEDLFSSENRCDIDSLDAVCFVLKAPDARLTTSQIYIFNSILSIFQKDIINNFCMFVTFADGKKPEVLAALKEANLPHEKLYPFNNSALFAPKSERNSLDSRRSELDWEMGNSSFHSFFENLQGLDKKSLALTREVLKERRRLDITIENMRAKLDVALWTIVEFRQEISLLKKSKKEIEKNKNFTYTVSEKKKVLSSSSTYHLNCNVCKSTCHRKCWALNYEFFIRRCDVMVDDKCSQCTGCCPPKNHKNEKEIYMYKEVQVTKTYADMEKKHNIAEKDMWSHKKVIENMEREMEQFEKEIEDMIYIIFSCNQRLEQIALREDPLRMNDLLDAWITEEKALKAPGWPDRIATYYKFKEYADMPSFAENVKQQLKEVREEAKFETNTKCKAE